MVTPTPRDVGGGDSTLWGGSAGAPADGNVTVIGMDVTGGLSGQIEDVLYRRCRTFGLEAENTRVTRLEKLAQRLHWRKDQLRTYHGWTVVVFRFGAMIDSRRQSFFRRTSSHVLVFQCHNVSEERENVRHATYKKLGSKGKRVLRPGQPLSYNFLRENPEIFIA